MQVIWHDDIATYGDVVHRMRSACEFQECCVHRIRCQDFPAPARAERDKEQGIVPEDASQPSRKLWIIRHRSSCSRRIVAAFLREALTFPIGKRLQAAKQLQGMHDKKISRIYHLAAVAVALRATRALRAAKRLQGCASSQAGTRRLVRKERPAVSRRALQCLGNPREVADLRK